MLKIAIMPFWVWMISFIASCPQPEIEKTRIINTSSLNVFFFMLSFLLQCSKKEGADANVCSLANCERSLPGELAQATSS
jgi:hypothetical protein